MKTRKLSRWISLLLFLALCVLLSACGGDTPSPVTEDSDSTVPATSDDPSNVDTTEGKTDDSDDPRTLEERFLEIQEMTPEFRYLEGYDDMIGDDQIRPVMLKSLPYHGHDSEIFAYYAVPATASEDTQVPAVILMPPSGGHPELDWVHFWLDAGYAVLGLNIQSPVMPDKDSKGQWIEYEEERYHPIYGEEKFYAVEDPAAYDEQWIFFATADAILANSVLRADNRIDADKIGITGFSLGTSALNVAITYDHRFAFAAPSCGPAFLHENYGISSARFSEDPAFAAVWEPSLRFDQVTCPVLFIGGARDYNYSCDIVSKSAEYCPGAALSVQYLMSHSAKSAEFAPEALWFASCAINGRNDALCKPMDESYDDATRTFSFRVVVPDVLSLSQIQFCYSETPFGTKEQMSDLPPQWQRIPVEVTDDNMYTVEVPESAAIFFAEITGDNGDPSILRRNVISSTYVHVLKTVRDPE